MPAADGAVGEDNVGVLALVIGRAAGGEPCRPTVSVVPASITRPVQRAVSCGHGAERTQSFMGPRSAGGGDGGRAGVLAASCG